MFKALIDWYMGALETGGYPLIALLMAVESSIVPLPSEVAWTPNSKKSSPSSRPLLAEM